jgi:mRNA interferase MazF
VARPVAGSVVLVDWRGDRLPNRPGGLRPAVVVEDTALIADGYPNVLVVPMTTDERYATYAAFVERIKPTPDNGAPEPCYAIAHHVTSVSIHRIRVTTATITTEQLQSIRRRIAVAIGAGGAT